MESYENNRCFEGMWIPKELWFNKDLTWFEKLLYLEIKSLDNENHCTASNQYFSDFFGESIDKVKKAIKKLLDFGYVEKISFDGRIRVLSAKRCLVDDENIEKCGNAPSEVRKCTTSNIYNIYNTKTFKQTNKQTSLLGVSEGEFEFGKPKEKKKSMFEKCSDLITEFTDDLELRNALFDYLDFLLKYSKDNNRQFYTNNFKGLLSNLKEVANDESEYLEIVKYSIFKCYWGFFPLNKNKVKSNDLENIDKKEKNKHRYEMSEDEYWSKKAKDENGNYVEF